MQIFTVLVIEASLSVIDAGAISVPIRSTKAATYMHRLNDEDPVPYEETQYTHDH